MAPGLLLWPDEAHLTPRNWGGLLRSVFYFLLVPWLARAVRVASLEGAALTMGPLLTINAAG